MTPKIFYGLTVAAAVSLSAAAISHYQSQSWSSSVAVGEVLFPDLAGLAEKVVSLSVQKGGETITITRLGDGWGIKDRSGFPADPEEVREAIVGLTQMTIVEDKTRNEARYKLLNLGDPALKDSQSKLLHLTGENDKTIATIILGKVKFGVLGPGRNGTYVRKPGDPQTWLVSGDIDAPTDVRGWAEKSIFEIAKESVSQIKIAHPDNEEVLLVRGEGEGDVFAFGLVNLPEGAKIKAGVDLSFVATAIAQLELWDVKKAQAVGDESAGQQVVSEIIAKDGLKVVVRFISSEGEDHWVTVEADGSDAAKKAAAAINARAKGWMFKIPTYKAENFKKRLSDLIDPAAPAEPEDGS